MRSLCNSGKSVLSLFLCIGQIIVIVHSFGITFCLHTSFINSYISCINLSPPHFTNSAHLLSPPGVLLFLNSSITSLTSCVFGSSVHLSQYFDQPALFHCSLCSVTPLSAPSIFSGFLPLLPTIILFYFCTLTFLVEILSLAVAFFNTNALFRVSVLDPQFLLIFLVPISFYFLCVFS